MNPTVGRAVGQGLKETTTTDSKPMALSSDLNQKSNTMPNITLAEPIATADQNAASDAEFLQQIPWTHEADGPLVKAARAGALKPFWNRLAAQVFGLGPRAGRKKVLERRDAAAMSLWGLSETTPLAAIWSELAGRWESARQSAVTHRTRKKNKSADNGAAAAIKVPRKQIAALNDWLESLQNASPSAAEQLILAEMLRLAGSSLPAKVGVPLWRRLLLAAGEVPVDGEIDTAAGLQTGEVPWVLGLFFAHIRGAETLRERGRNVFRTLLEEHTDTDGTLRAQEMERLSDWFPPLVRAAEWALAAEVPLWKKTASAERFQSLIGRLAGCFSSDGHLALDQTNADDTLTLLLTAARLAGGSKKEWPLKFLLEAAEVGAEHAAAPSKKHSAKLKTSRRRKPDASVDDIVQQSDWARVACLRSHSGVDADVFAVTHHQPLPRIDFSVLGRAILQGPWELAVAFDKKPAALPEEWTCVCWHTDSDGDYLELQYSIDENRRIERQVFLSRTDHFLVLADCVSGAGEAVIDYTARLPLVAGALIHRHDSTREQVITLGNHRIRTFPLALPEDIVHSTPGFWGLSETSQSPSLEIRQTSKGGLYAPVVLDWTPARQNTDADWRTLTITENGPKVQSDRAAGHRIRIGNQQLLIYRSIAPTDELRTVLGHHTGHETIIARFDKSGDVKPLLIVE